MCVTEKERERQRENVFVRDTVCVTIDREEKEREREREREGGGAGKHRTFFFKNGIIMLKEGGSLPDIKFRAAKWTEGCVFVCEGGGGGGEGRRGRATY